MSVVSKSAICSGYLKNFLFQCDKQNLFNMVVLIHIQQTVIESIVQILLYHVSEQHCVNVRLIVVHTETVFIKNLDIELSHPHPYPHSSHPELSDYYQKATTNIELLSGLYKNEVMQ